MLKGEKKIEDSKKYIIKKKEIYNNKFDKEM